MKRMLKKLAAIALVGAMALSLSVSALATGGIGTPTISGTGAQGSASGQVESQGKIPDDVVKVRMPLTADGVFNMYVDPHNLIRESGNALEVGGAGTAVDLFATDTLVYFPNRTDGSLTGFSKTSDPIEVTNMSNVPVTIGMTATWTMGNGNSYDLAKSADDLAASKTAGDAAMYLTLDDTLGHSAAVVKANKGTPTLTYAPTTSSSNVVSPKETNYLDSYIKSIDFAFTSDATAEDVKLLNEGGPIYTNATAGNVVKPSDWTFTFAKSDKKTPTVTFNGPLPTYTTMSGTAPNQTRKLDNAYTIKVQSGQNVSITAALQMDGNYIYSVPNGEAKTVIGIHRGTSGPAVATITIDWDYEAIGANSYEVTQTLTDKDDPTKTDTYTIATGAVTGATGSGAKLSNDLNTTEDSYKLAKDDSTGKLKWVFNEDKGFSAEAVDKFQSVSFSLTAAITDGEVCAKAWDDAFTTATNSQLELVWAVSQCSAVDPTVTVTSPLTSATGSAELKVDWGYGDAKATAIKSVSFKAGSSNGTVPEANITVDGATVTISAANANGLFAEAGANGVVTITFTTMSGEKDVEVNLKTAAT